MPRPKSISDESILDAARHVFQRDGHAAATRAVAKEAGISQAVLYQRFGSKEQLFCAAMLPADVDFEALLDESRARSARAFLEQIALRLYRHLRVHLPIVLQAASHPSFNASELSEAHQRHASRLHSALASRLEALRQEGKLGDLAPDHLAATLVAIVHSQALHSMFSGDDTRAEKQLATMVKVVWDGAQP